MWGAYEPGILDSQDPKAAIGGGEAALLQTSFHLALRGHDVTVYYPGEMATHRGVSFKPWWMAHAQVGQAGRYDAVVSWSDKQVLQCCAPTVKRVFMQQLNDLAGPPGFIDAIDVLVSPSATHLAFLQGWLQDRKRSLPMVVVPSGVEVQRYTDAVPFAHRKPMVSWWSSPDRGFHHLALIWPEVRRRVPNAELHVFYHLDRFVRDLAGSFQAGEIAWRASMLKALRGALTPANGVYVHGAVSRTELARWQKQTKVLAMPFDPVVPTEGFGVSYLEGLAAGCRVIARPDDALPELFGDAVEWIEAPVCTEAFRRKFADSVVQALSATSNPRRDAAARVVERFTWGRAAEAMEQALNIYLPGGMLNHG